jgi:signal transduction histidine kinase
MRRSKAVFKASAIPDATLRRLRVTPSYFFIVWRWCMWLYALVDILYIRSVMTSPAFRTGLILLAVTLIQTLAVTFVPVFQLLLPSRMPSLFRRFRLEMLQEPLEDEEMDFLKPLAQTRSLWGVAIYGLDLLICGLVTYFGGPLGFPPFGNGSPFYRYGLSTVFAAAMVYRYQGGLVTALIYDLFIVAGILFPAPGAYIYSPTIIDIMGSLVDAPLAALLAAYVATLIANYARSKKREQTNVRRQRALLSVSEAILSEVNDRERLLQKAVKQLQRGGHFQRLVVALVSSSDDAGLSAGTNLSYPSSNSAGTALSRPSDHRASQTTDTIKRSLQGSGESESGDILVREIIETCIEANVADALLPERNPAYIDQVLRTKQKISSFEYFNPAQFGGNGIARLYLPLFKEGQLQMIIGAESLRQTPFESKREEFLTIAGGQLLVALENMRLAEQTIQLAATAERGRIAREIHDGIAQLTYMLSLNAETCAVQAHRIAEASEEDAELLMPLAERLDKLVIVSKQALWETRNYMFSLRPLMSGDSTLSQMLTSQIQEFQTISDLPVQLEIEGSEGAVDGEQYRVSKYAQVGATLFRIVQEALTNAYKHAGATQLWVHLRYLPDSIEVAIRDNGRGLSAAPDGQANGEEPRIYSGHGLHGMRERAEELGGSFEISQQASGGVQVRVCIPV